MKLRFRFAECLSGGFVMASLEEQKGSTYLCSLIMAAAGPEGMAWRCVREGHTGKGFFTRGWRARPKLLVWIVFSDIGLNFEWPCVEPGVGLSDTCWVLTIQDIL